MDALKAAVVGIGAMGQHHARIYAELSSTNLVAVCDLDENLLGNVTRTWGAETYTDAGKMLDREVPDVVSVCVPTSLHREIAGMCLCAGAHVLIEKPITATVKEARQLISLARANDKTLMVGHIERFNPAARALQGLVGSGRLGEVYCISSRRAGPSPQRIRDVGVTVDLAVHDIDLMRWIVGEDAAVVCAAVQHRNHGPLEDAVDGMLMLGGVVGILHADWLTCAKIRDLTVIGSGGTARADLLGKQIEVWNAPGQSYSQLTLGIEPLKAEIKAFIEAVQEKKEPPVTGADGIAALEIALALVEAGEANLQIGG